MDGKVKSFWVKVNEIIITYCFGLFMEKPYFCRDFLVWMLIWDKGLTHAQLISNALTHNTVNCHILGQFGRWWVLFFPSYLANPKALSTAQVTAHLPVCQAAQDYSTPRYV